MKTLSSAGILVLILSASSLAMVGCKTQSSAASSESGVTAASKPYPLQKCVVSGEALEQGKTYDFVYKGQDVKLCCKDCLADFNKDPDKYMAKIAQAK